MDVYGLRVSAVFIYATLCCTDRHIREDFLYFSCRIYFSLYTVLYGEKCVLQLVYMTNGVVGGIRNIDRTRIYIRIIFSQTLSSKRHNAENLLHLDNTPGYFILVYLYISSPSYVYLRVTYVNYKSTSNLCWKSLCRHRRRRVVQQHAHASCLR